MRATTVVATTLVVVLAALAGLHLYWAVGGRGIGAATIPTRLDGRPLLAPSPAATILVAVALVVAAWIVAVVGGVARPFGPRLLYRVGAWGLGLVLLGRAVGDFRYVGAFKRVHDTRFAALDDRFYTPLCAALAIGTLWLAWRGGRGGG